MIRALMMKTTLKQRIAMGFGIGILLTALIIYISFQSVEQTRNAFGEFVELNEKSNQELMIGRWVQIMQKQVKEYIHTQRKDIPAEVERYYRHIRQVLDERRQHSERPDEITRIVLHLDKYFAAFEEAVPGVMLKNRLYHQDIPEKSSRIQSKMRDFPVAVSESFVQSELNFYYFLNTLNTSYLVAARTYQDELKAQLGQLSSSRSETLTRIIEEHYDDLNSLLQLNRNILFLTNVVMAAEAAEVLYLSKELALSVNRQRQLAEQQIVMTTEELTSKLLVAGALLLLGAWLLIIQISRSITEPMEALTEAFNKLTDGHTGITIPAFKTNDELGNLARAAAAFNEKNEETKPLLHASNHLTAQLQARDRELQAINENLEKRIREAVTRVEHQDEIIFRQMRERSISELLVNIAHQWRQPLNVIAIEAQNIMDVVEYDQSDPKEIEAIVETIVQKTVDLSDIITHFAQLHQSPSGEKEHFLLKDAIEQSIHLLEGPVKRSGVLFRRIGSEEIRLLHYRQYFVDIYMALMKNALEAFIQKEIAQPVITLECGVEKDALVLTIEDNAGGIDESIRDVVFDPYQTTNFKSSEKGMGLYFVKRITEAHLHGSITLDHLEQGTRFILRIPHESR